MHSGLSILNLGLMAVLLVAAVSVHARDVSETHNPLNPAAISPKNFVQ